MTAEQGVEVHVHLNRPGRVSIDAATGDITVTGTYRRRTVKITL